MLMRKACFHNRTCTLSKQAVNVVPARPGNTGAYVISMSWAVEEEALCSVRIAHKLQMNFGKQKK